MTSPEGWARPLSTLFHLRSVALLGLLDVQGRDKLSCREAALPQKLNLPIGNRVECKLLAVDRWTAPRGHEPRRVKDGGARMPPPPPTPDTDRLNTGRPDSKALFRPELSSFAPNTITLEQLSAAALCKSE